ncbi:RHS repeat-associated core domain-containing protein [Pseudophaeobacter sp.]|uniref:RHS repeat-associated core domain-containing protein n=1 Tax=Pseudophaeobacter sp. TaxID=1971739 RepID=UPI003299EB0E
MFLPFVLTAPAYARGIERVGTVPYAPFGIPRDWVSDIAASAEDHAYIGERFDAAVGLIFLNARYYDPELGLFTQPDWFEVTKQGVGTNRYAYSGNDLINFSDPEGND